MQKTLFIRNHSTVTQLIPGKPTIPGLEKQPMVERKITDPSSSAPKGERYPIPTFFEYRIKPREYDPL